jgi:hypothetical protein
MRTNKAFEKQERKRGAALMTLMIIILLVTGTGAYLVKDAKQQAFAVTRVRDYLTAQAYAEAGANYAYSLLKTNFALRTDSSRFPLTTYSDGTYGVTVTSVGTNKASISCTGRRGLATANVTVDLNNFGVGAGGGGASTAPAAVGAYTYAIVSGGAMGWSGSGNINVGAGKLHGNGQFKMTGSKKVIGNISSSVKIWLTGSTKITGNATAPAINAGGSAITGTKTIGSVPNVTIPNIDLTPYYNAALANGEVYNGDRHFTGSADVAPNGGIMWVNGNFKWSGSGKLIGCFIATGDFDYSGSGDQIKVGNYPAFVSRDGTVDISGSGKSHGLIYAKTGGFDKSGSGDHIGTIIVNGDFGASGSWSALSYENSTPVAPTGSGGGSSSDDRVCVIAWQK